MAESWKFGTGRARGWVASLPFEGFRFHFQALLPSARYERRVGVSLVRAAWERRPEGPAYLLSSVTLLYLAGLCAF